VTLQSGQSQQFTVVGRLSDGSTAAVAVTWSATGGTVTANGLYAAGATAGTYRVIASAATGLADTSDVTIAASTITAITVTPASVTLASGQTRQFTAVATLSNGATQNNPSVTWTATGGTVTGGGLYTAGSAAGSAFRVIAASANGKADTSAVTITASGPTLTQLVLSPASVSLAAAATQQFTVSGTWSDGSSTTPAVSYSATGGTISAGGLYTAGGAAGTFRVIASHVGGTLKDTADVTITSGGGGGTVLVSEGFETGNLATNGWFDASTVTITTDARPGSSGTHALQWHWTTGSVSPQGSSRINFTPSTSVYLSYWIKESSNWIGSGEPWHPHMFHFLTTVDDQYIGPSISHLTLYDELIYKSGQGGSFPNPSLQDALMIDPNNLMVDLTNVTEQRAIGGYNGRPETSSPGGNITWDAFDYGGGLYTNYKMIQPAGSTLVMTDATKNSWHHVESYWQLNTISGGKGQRDGVVQYWFDGVQLVDRRDIYFRTGVNPSMQFRTFVMAPYIGDGSPVDQYMWIDDLVVMTAKP
jgi:hypothetical protein